MRPASNAIACIPDKTQLMTAGVCTASAGNFAQVRDTSLPTFLVVPPWHTSTSRAWLGAAKSWVWPVRWLLLTLLRK